MKIKQIILIILTFIVITIMVLFITPEELISNIQKISRLEIIILLIILVIADMGARTVRWWILLISQNGPNKERIPIKSLINPMLSSTFLNIVFPARAGEVVRLYSLKKKNNISYSTGLSVIVVEQVINLLSLILVASIALVSILITGIEFQNESLQQLIPIGILGLFSALSGIFLLIVIDPVKFTVLLNPFPQNLQVKGKKLLSQLSIGLKNLRSNLFLLLSALGTSMLVWIFEGIMIWLMAIEIISPLYEFSISLLASTVGNFTFIFPILPGAIGQYEIFLALVLSFSQYYNQAEGGAAVIALLDRIVKTVVLAIIGGYATFVLGVRDIFKKETSEIQEIEDIKK